MKKHISVFTFILSITLISCEKSPEDKAHELVKQYIKIHANDPESYEPIEFGRIDTFNSIDGRGNPIKKLEIVHRFRAKNALGAKIIEDKRFIFNITLDSILTMTGPLAE